MRLGIAADHGGFALKENSRDVLRRSGHEIVDFDACSFDRDDDYPDYVVPLVADGEP